MIDLCVFRWLELRDDGFNPDGEMIGWKIGLVFCRSPVARACNADVCGGEDIIDTEAETGGVGRVELVYTDVRTGEGVIGELGGGQ